MWNKFISSAFNDWAKTYESDVSKSFQRRGTTYEYIWKKIYEELSVGGNSHLIEIGVGTGLLGDYWGSHRVVGLDISEGMLELAAERGTYTELIHAAANRLPFLNNTFDGVYTSFMFHSERRPKRFLKECWRVIKPGGRLVVVDLFPRYRQDKFCHFLWSNLHSMRYEKFSPSLYKPIEEKRKLFKRDFNDVRSYYIDSSHDVPSLAKGYMSHGLISGVKRISPF